MTIRLAVTAGLVALTALPIGAQTPDPSIRARVDGFFKALSSYDPAAFEAMAREAFTPEALARRTADDRRELLERMKADFGTMTLGGVRRSPDGKVTLMVSGSSGMSGRIGLDLEPEPPHRITGVSIEVGSDEGMADAPPPPPIDGAMPAAELSRVLDDHIAALAQKEAFAGVILVAKDGNPVYQKAYGVADRETNSPATAATRYNLGSIVKIFTKVAIAQLVAQGRLSLTDTLGKLLPDYPNHDAHPATVDQLLTHRVGIADFFGPKFEKASALELSSNADYYRFVAPMPLLFEPGAKRQYCNGCYIVVGAIVERLSGMPYEDYIRRHVFEPAGMTGAGFFHSAKLPAAVARGYTRRSPGQSPGSKDGPLQNSARLHGRAGSAAGGAYATAADLLAFDTALRSHKLTDPKQTAWVLGSGAGRQAARRRASASPAGRRA